jgi:uncharacterized protein (DUF2267 family)
MQFNEKFYHIQYKAKTAKRFMSGQINELASTLAQRVGITPEQANTAITIVSRTLLQKADGNKASSLLSKLPSGITSMFSDGEKEQFKNQKQDISNEQVMQQIKRETGINDDNKARQVTTEGVKILQEKTGEEGLLDNVMGRFGKMDLNPFD